MPCWLLRPANGATPVDSGMKLSVSISEGDVVTLDEFVRSAGLASAPPRYNGPSSCSAIRASKRNTRRPGWSGRPPVTRPPGTLRPLTGCPTRRGDVRLTDLETTRGSEADRQRPAVVVSNDRAINPDLHRPVRQTGSVPEPWTAPRAHGPVRGRVTLPGSKSQTNRSLVLAAVAVGPSQIGRPLAARDTELMAGALRAMGVAIEIGPQSWRVTPAALHGASVDTGLAGTVMRFLPPVATLADGDVRFDGDPYARNRPMAVLIDGLRQAGAVVEDAGRARLPFTVRGTGSAPGGVIDIDASASSQFVSAFLLAGARWDKGVHLRHVGAGPVPSAPHIAMTVAALRARGVEVDDSSPREWAVAPGPVAALDVTIEPDLSNAAPFLAAALVTGGSVTVPGWPAVTDQAGDALRDLLTAMGADVRLDAAGLTVTGTGALTGIDADLGDVGELSPVLAALAALADGPSRLSGIGHLRGHETDRLAALAKEITALGGDVTEYPDGLAIVPRPLSGGRWHAYADHRMAQAGAVIGLAVDGVEVDDIASTTKTLADFPGMWARLLAG